MEIIVTDTNATIRATGIRDAVFTFDDVMSCLHWAGEKMQGTGAACSIMISDISLLLRPDQRAAFQDLYKKAPHKGADFIMHQYNGPIHETVLAYWWKSQPEKWRNKVRAKIKKLKIFPD